MPSIRKFRYKGHITWKTQTTKAHARNNRESEHIQSHIHNSFHNSKLENVYQRIITDGFTGELYKKIWRRNNVYPTKSLSEYGSGGNAF